MASEQKNLNLYNVTFAVLKKCIKFIQSLEFNTNNNITVTTKLVKNIRDYGKVRLF